MECLRFSDRLPGYHPARDFEGWRDPSLSGEQPQSREAAIAGHNPVLRIFAGHHQQALYLTSGVDPLGKCVNGLRADPAPAARREAEPVQCDTLNGRFWGRGGEGASGTMRHLLSGGMQRVMAREHNRFRMAVDRPGPPGTHEAVPDKCRSKLSLASVA